MWASPAWCPVFTSNPTAAHLLPLSSFHFQTFVKKNKKKEQINVIHWILCLNLHCLTLQLPVKMFWMAINFISTCLFGVASFAVLLTHHHKVFYCRVVKSQRRSFLNRLASAVGEKKFGSFWDFQFVLSEFTNADNAHDNNGFVTAPSWSLTKYEDSFNRQPVKANNPLACLVWSVTEFFFMFEQNEGKMIHLQLVSEHIYHHFNFPFMHHTCGIALA